MCLGRFEAKRLSARDAAELLGMSERKLPALPAPLRGGRSGGSVRPPARQGLGAAGSGGPGSSGCSRSIAPATWAGRVKHFHDHLREHHGFTLSYTWTKTHPAARGVGVQGRPNAGAHRRRRPAQAPAVGMMLHQDGSRHEWLSGQAACDLIVTLDDATSEIYSAFLVEEEGTASTFRALKKVFTEHGLPGALYTDRGSHYFHTPEAGRQGGQGPAHPGRARAPSARHRAHRRLLPRGKGSLRARPSAPCRIAWSRSWRWPASRHRRGRQPLHPRALPAPTTTRRFATPPASSRTQPSSPSSGPDQVDDTLCVHAERVVANDNTVRYAGRALQLPAGPERPHYVKAQVRVHEYPDGTLAVFHGPRCLARYHADGEPFETPTRKAA